MIGDVEKNIWELISLFSALISVKLMILTLVYPTPFWKFIFLFSSQWNWWLARTKWQPPESASNASGREVNNTTPASPTMILYHVSKLLLQERRNVVLLITISVLCVCLIFMMPSLLLRACFISFLPLKKKEDSISAEQAMIFSTSYSELKINTKKRILKIGKKEKNVFSKVYKNEQSSQI